MKATFIISTLLIMKNIAVCNDTERDCNGICFGNDSIDSCGKCVEESSTDWNSCIGCDNVINSNKKLNQCNHCALSTDPNFEDYGQDCRNICAGINNTYYMDGCQQCLLTTDDKWNYCITQPSNTELTTVIVIVCIVVFLIIMAACIIIGALWKKQTSMNHTLASTYVHMDDHEMADSIGLAMGGAKDVNNFRKCIEENIMPSVGSITYNGLLYEYYFDTKKRKHIVMKENKQDDNGSDLFYPSYCYAKINKLNFNKNQDDDDDWYEYYMSVGLNSNIKQKDFKRKKLNLVVVVDKSGSMNHCFYNECNGKSKMEIANESVVGLLKHLTPNDRFGLIVFDNESVVKQKIDFIKNIDMDKLKNKILDIEASDGTNFECGYKKGVDLYLKNNIQTDEEYDNRLIFLTDANPNEGIIDAKSLLNLVDKYSNNKENYIYTTFIGVGLDFKASLIETISNTRGCNYYSVKSTQDFNQTMDKEFDFMVTPLVFNVCLKLKCEGNSCEIDKVYGSSVENEANIIKNGEIVKINTLFASKKSKEKGGSKGGIQLIKLKKIESNKNDNINVEIEVRFEDKYGKIYKNEQCVIFHCNHDDNHMIENDNNYFDNIGIRKGIILCKYVELLSNWIEYENKQNGLSKNTLRVNNEYKKVFNEFRSYFKKEMKQCHDNELEKELNILNKLINIQ